MFQNVSSSARIESNTKKENKITDTLKELFNVHSCIIYVLTFLVSMVSIKNEIIPFGLAIVAACIGSTVPIFMVYLISFLSTWIFYGVNGLTTFFFTSIIFFIILFIFKPKISLEDRNEVLKVGMRLFFASFLYSLIDNIMGTFLIYDLFLGIVIAALTYTFYKIFVNGIVVIRDFGVKKAFTIEEIIAVAIIFAVAISVLKDVTIFSLSVSNILIIFIILALGWKNGMLVGGTAGLSIGLVLTLIGNATVLQLAVFAVSGILAGILNKFGKIGVIVGFLLGNAILTYLVNGNTDTIIYFREIFVAACFLLLVPSNVKINIEDLFGREKLLTNNGDKKFEYYEDIKNKLNTAIQNIDEINSNAENSSDIEIKKEIYIDNFLESFDEHEENIFYDEVSQNENLIGDIFDVFQKEDIITENIMINIFKKYNNYILLRDQKVKDDLQELIKYANRTYRQMQMKNVKEKTKLEEKHKRKSELTNVKTIIKKVADEELETKFENKEKEIKILLKNKGYNINSVSVSKSLNGKYIINLDLKFDETIRDKAKIKNIADIISRVFNERFVFQKDRKNLKTELYTQTYSSEDKFMLQVGSSKVTKEGSKISGDSNLQIRLDDGKYLLAISDGMGTRERGKTS